MSYSTYITSWNGSAMSQVVDLIDKSVLKENTRIILAFASFNFSSMDYIPGLSNLSISDLNNLTSIVHASNAKISLSIGGATYPFYNSDLYKRPGDLANNINTLINKCGFDGVDFDIEDYFQDVPSDFVYNTASLINTLRSLNKDLNITLTIPAQAWNPNNYQKSLIDLTIANINALQPMEYDIWISPSSNYCNQIQFDINYYLNNWKVNPNKIILGLMPGKDDTNKNLTLQDALNLTSFAKSKNLQGVMTWDVYIDSQGCDGNAPYAYSLGIESLLNKSKLLKKYQPPKKYYGKNTLKLKDSSPMPPPFPPISPPLTDIEIQKIKANLTKIHDFNFELNSQQSDIITEVFTQLQGTQFSLPKDKGKDWFLSLIEIGFGVGAVLAPYAVIEIGLVICIGAMEYFTNESSTFNEHNTDINLDKEYSNILQRVDNTYKATQIFVGNMFDDPNTYRDQEFTYNNKTHTLRDFINGEFPDRTSTIFNTTIRLICRQFRSQITIPEMIEMQFWDIYFVEEREGHLRWGCAFPPEQYESGEDIQRSRLFDKNNVGDGVRIFSNDEVRKWNPDYIHIEAFGNNNDDLKSSYIHAINYFINGEPKNKKLGFPASLIYPWTVTNKSVYSNRWYILEGYDKITRPTEHFPIANGDFMSWLFIDDGGGNVINTEGVMYRYDILNFGILSNGGAIPKENIIPNDEQILFKSSDYQYQYPGCSDKITSNRVYTGDFY